VKAADFDPTYLHLGAGLQSDLLSRRMASAE
jgi:hypothetical protein